MAEQLSADMPRSLTRDESSPATKEERFSRTVGYYAAFVALGLVGASLGPTLRGLAENTRTLLSEISIVFSARALGYLVGSFLGGRLYDRAPGHRMMAAALIVMAITMVLVPLIPLLGLLSGVLLVVGVAEGVLDVGGNTLLVWTFRDRVGPFMNGLHFFFGVGAFLSPIIIAQAVLMRGDITLAYWVLAALMIPVVVWLLRLPNPRIRADAHDVSAGQVNSDQKSSAKPILVGLIAVFFFLYAGAEIGFGGWIYTYAVELNLSSEATAAYLTSGFWGALTLGRLLAIPIAARFRPRSILVADFVGAFVSIGVVLLWPNSLAATWLGALGLGLSLASVFPTTLSLAERRMTITGRVTGWFFVGASSGGMSLPWLIGQLFEAVGPRMMILAIAVDLVLTTAIFCVLIVYSSRMVTHPAPSV
jgi:FHS family Na+ dependent glucose MFS transporter 1